MSSEAEAAFRFRCLEHFDRSYYLSQLHTHDTGSSTARDWATCAEGTALAFLPASRVYASHAHCHVWLQAAVEAAIRKANREAAAVALVEKAGMEAQLQRLEAKIEASEAKAAAAAAAANAAVAAVAAVAAGTSSAASPPPPPPAPPVQQTLVRLSFRSTRCIADFSAIIGGSCSEHQSDFRNLCRPHQARHARDVRSSPSIPD
jgi:hypothetical protein